ncbi:MAG: hypothetical protein M1838_000767 [Thelocarpon superellum]|nr:MAG: hypothetical protein M1838_000767 [Thelocarpon superellum]
MRSPSSLLALCALSHLASTALAVLQSGSGKVATQPGLPPSQGPQGASGQGAAQGATPSASNSTFATTSPAFPLANDSFQLFAVSESASKVIQLFDANSFSSDPSAKGTNSSAVPYNPIQGVEVRQQMDPTTFRIQNGSITGPRNETFDLNLVQSGPKNGTTSLVPSGNGTSGWSFTAVPGDNKTLDIHLVDGQGLLHELQNNALGAQLNWTYCQWDEFSDGPNVLYWNSAPMGWKNQKHTEAAIDGEQGYNISVNGKDVCTSSLRLFALPATFNYFEDSSFA